MRAFARPHRWLLLLWLLIAFIAVLSLAPTGQLKQIGVPDWNDKLGHFTAYFVLSAWCAQLYASGRAMLRSVLFCLLLGLSLEALQSLTATRSAEWRDMLANTLGVIAGGMTWFSGFAGSLLRLDAR